MVIMEREREFVESTVCDSERLGDWASEIVGIIESVVLSGSDALITLELVCVRKVVTLSDAVNVTCSDFTLLGDAVFVALDKHEELLL
jgi:hypothetical protein